MAQSARTQTYTTMHQKGMTSIWCMHRFDLPRGQQERLPYVSRCLCWRVASSGERE